MVESGGWNGPTLTDPAYRPLSATLQFGKNEQEGTAGRAAPAGVFTGKPLPMRSCFAPLRAARLGFSGTDRKPDSGWESSFAVEGVPYFPSIASRRALNSLPGFHSGGVSALATSRPIANSSCASLTPPSKVHSGLMTSLGWW
jgi:hypothetical protein